jgi:hypothetical protein
VILLVGCADDDAPLAAIAAELLARDEPYVVFDPDDPLATVGRAWHPDREAVVTTSTATICLDEICAAYLRPASRPGRAAQNCRALSTVLTWSEFTPAVVVNRPAACAANTSKPYQLEMIRAFGFATPATLTTTSPDAARAFVQEVGRAVYKSVSADRSMVGEVDPRDTGRLRDVVHCPTQFQQLVDGDDLRVHVVGGEAHALRIRSMETDYRYVPPEGALPTATLAELDPDPRGRLIAMTRAMGLRFAGIDLRESGDGTLYCLEVNPSPGFTFYERLSGVPIAPFVADLLTHETPDLEPSREKECVHAAQRSDM